MAYGDEQFNNISMRRGEKRTEKPATNVTSNSTLLFLRTHTHTHAAR
jgi:hypothetical protein